MLYELFAHRADEFGLFNLLNYLTFRTGAALVTAFFLTVLMGAPMIGWLRSKQGKGQPIRADGPESHIIEKAGTPTMGGLLIALGLLISTILWADWGNGYVWAILLVTTGFGLIGFADDFAKVKRYTTEGVSGRLRLLLEFAVAGVAVVWIMALAEPGAARFVEPDTAGAPAATSAAADGEDALEALLVEVENALRVGEDETGGGIDLAQGETFRGAVLEVVSLPMDVRWSGEAVVEAWLAQPGAELRVGDRLMQVGKDGQTFTVVSPFQGVLERHVVQAGDTVAAGQSIGAAIRSETGWQRVLFGYGSQLAVPFFKDILIPLGPAFILLGAIWIVGFGNAVNLTDGLDGLAIVPVMIAGATLAFIAYLVGNSVYSDYLQLHYMPGTGEISVVLGALLGAGLGFLWYNAPPAKVFMGDTGSLALGATLGAVAVAVKHELVLVIIGGLFVLETLSVMVQVFSYKTFGKRVFRMAPIHHHFEKMGWKEPTIVIRFWIIAVMLALAGLATLKLR